MNYSAKQFPIKFFLVGLLGFTQIILFGQKNYSFSFQGVNDIENEKIIPLELDTLKAQDSLDVYQKLGTLLNKFRRDAYLACSVDKLEFQDSIVSVSFYLGDKFKWVDIKVDSNYQQFTGGLKFPMSINSNVRLDPIQLSNHFEDLISFLENNGYPFAQVSIANPVISQAEMSGNLDLRKNQLILFDTIHLVPNRIISRNFLHRFLEIKKNSHYSKEKVLGLKNEIRKLPYLKLKSDPIINFIADKAIINLDLQKRNASRFDFLFGILPSTQNGESSLTIAVDFTADLMNKLGYGERFYASFQRLKEESQELELAFNFPYVLDTPFGIDTRFELFRNAGEYIELETDLGISYFFGGNNYLKIFYNLNSSRLLDIDSTAILNSRRLPSQLDISYSAGGLEFGWQNLNYNFNPLKGINVLVRGSAGFKETIQNNEIISLKNEVTDFTSAYDSLNLNAYQFRFETDMALYIPVGRRTTLKSFFKGGWILAEEAAYSNELFRIGGHKILRGFDEESILADFYSVLGLEFRLLLAENSYLSLPFFDVGFIQNKSNENKEWDTLMGMGGGIHFETKAGIFSFSVAIGKQSEGSFDFGSTKAHFGYVSLF